MLNPIIVTSIVLISMALEGGGHYPHFKLVGGGGGGGGGRACAPGAPLLPPPVGSPF